MEKMRFVQKEFTRMDTVERYFDAHLLSAYESKKESLAVHGFPFEEKPERSFPIIDMILDDEECMKVIKILKNGNASFENLKTFELIINKKPSDVVNWLLLREFKLDQIKQQYLDRKLSRLEFAIQVLELSLVSFFHNEVQQYWTQPILAFLLEAEKTIKEEGDQLIDIFQKNDEIEKMKISERNLTYCIRKKIPDLMANQFKKFIQLAHDLEFMFDYIFKDDFDKYFQKLQINPAFEKENMAVVNIYLQSNTIETWTQQMDYTFWTLACDIGGALGLFLGASVVTILEILYIFYQHYNYRKHRKETERDTSIGPSLPGEKFELKKKNSAEIK